MAEKTGISWTRSTFNSWIGCTKVGPGCDGCYAEALDKRMKYGGAAHWGAGVPRYRTSASNWAKPLAWNKAAPESEFAGRKGFWPVFCASLGDVFDNEVPQGWRADLFELIEQTPNLSWLLVTKRISNVRGMVPTHWNQDSLHLERDGFPPNVRILITVVNQEEADRDIPKLLALPCKNGISYEPALGPIDWTPWLCDGIPTKVQVEGERGAHYLRHGAPRLDWIIVGGESSQPGHPARPFNVQWARSTIDQCKAAGVPVFVKQMGSTPIEEFQPRCDHFLSLSDRAGADPAEWAEDLRIREFPE